MEKVDVVIIGSGPAGLSAAVYTSRAGLSTLIVEGESGGLLTTTDKIDNYLGLYGSTGTDMADNFKEHARQFGARYLSAEATRIVKNDDNEFMVSVNRNSDNVSEIVSDAVIYSAGSSPKKLGVVGEDLEGVSYCATCDGIFFSGQDVVVVGGGETAVEEALYLSNVAHKVYVLLRGNKWRATKPAVKNLEAIDNVEIMKSTSISAIQETDGFVSSVVLNSNDVLDVQGVFVAIGQNPNSEIAENHTVLYEDGFVKCSHEAGFFVAGDIVDPDYRQVAVAVGSGAKAGIDTTRYVNNR